MEILMLLSVFAGGFICGYKYRDRDQTRVVFQLKDCNFFEHWIADCGSNMFGWWTQNILDNKFGNYNFRYVDIRVTGRKASPLQIKESLYQYAELYNYRANFVVLINKKEDCDIIRIIYVVPEYEHEFFLYEQRKKEVKAKKEAEKEKNSKLLESVGKK